MKYYGEDREIPTLMSEKKRQQLIDFCSKRLGKDEEAKNLTIEEIFAEIKKNQRSRWMSTTSI